MTTPKKSKAKRNKNNTTGYHGVTMSNGSYVAQIYHHGKTFRLGKFKKASDAARAYDTEASKVFGDRAKLNFPPKAKAS